MTFPDYNRSILRGVLRAGMFGAEPPHDRPAELTFSRGSQVRCHPDGMGMDALTLVPRTLSSAGADRDPPPAMIQGCIRPPPRATNTLLLGAVPAVLRLLGLSLYFKEYARL
jgi:hypothetical protein